VNTGYILGAWFAVMVVLAVYASYVISRGRRLSRLVPVERRRWVDTDAVDAFSHPGSADGG
jgi:hypothetical protein